MRVHFLYQGNQVLARRPGLVAELMGDNGQASRHSIIALLRMVRRASRRQQRHEPYVRIPYVSFQWLYCRTV
jgi:adenylylsulfate kinase-like enzyme